MTGVVAGIGFRAIAGAAVGKAASAGKSALSWLGSLDLVHALLLAVALFGAWQTVGRWAQHRHTAKIEAQLGKCTVARAGDHAAYVKGQADAATQNKAQVAAKEAQSKKVSDDEKNAYARDRAELVRMRAQRDAAAKRAAGSAAAPKDSAAGPRPDGHGMPIPAPDDVQKTRDDAADIELRLMHLQNYVEQQVAIDPNKDASNDPHPTVPQDFQPR